MSEAIYFSETVHLQPDTSGRVFDAIQQYLYGLYSTRLASPDYLFLEESDYDVLVGELSYVPHYAIIGSEVHTSRKDITEGRAIEKIGNLCTGKYVTVAHLPNLAPGSIMVLYQEHVQESRISTMLESSLEMLTRANNAIHAQEQQNKEGNNHEVG